MRETHFGNRTQVMVEQGRLVLQLIDNLNTTQPEIGQAILTLAGLMASQEKELALLKLYDAWQRQEDTLLNRGEAMGWPRQYYDELLEAMKECRAQLDAAPLGEATLAVDELNRRAETIISDATKNAPQPKAAERRWRPFWGRLW